MKLVPVDYVFDADERSTGTLSRPTFILPDSLNNVRAVSLQYANLPTSFKTVGSDLSSLCIVVGANTRFVVIPDGQFNSYAEFEAAIRNQVKSEFLALDATFANTFNCYVENQSLQLFLISDVAFSVTVFNATATQQVDFSVSHAGFPQPVTYDIYFSVNAAAFPTYNSLMLPQTTGHYIRSPLAVSPWRVPHLYLHCDLGASLFETVKSSQNQDTIIDSVPQLTYRPQTIVYEPNSPTYDPTQIHSISRLTFWVTQADRRFYDSPTGIGSTDHLHFYGHGFTLGVRFWVLEEDQVDVQVKNPYQKRLPVRDFFLEGVPKKRLRV